MPKAMTELMVAGRLALRAIGRHPRRRGGGCSRDLLLRFGSVANLVNSL